MSNQSKPKMVFFLIKLFHSPAYLWHKWLWLTLLEQALKRHLNLFSVGWRKWQPTPVFLPGKSHGQRSLAGYHPRDCRRVGHDLVTNNNSHLGSFCHFHSIPELCTEVPSHCPLLLTRGFSQSGTVPTVPSHVLLPMAYWVHTDVVNRCQLSSAFSPSSSAVYCVWYPSLIISFHLLTSSEGSSFSSLFTESFVLSVLCCLKMSFIITPLNNLTTPWRRITGQNTGRAPRSLSSEPVSQTSESADFHQTSFHVDELCCKSPIEMNEVLLQFQCFVLRAWLWSRERVLHFYSC